MAIVLRFALKIAAGSQKELEKVINEVDPASVPDLRKLKARIELIADFEDVKKITEFLKQLAKG